MAHQTIVEKKLYLRFKGSDRKAKNLIIAHPDEKLKKIKQIWQWIKLWKLIFLKKKESNCIKFEEMLAIRIVEWTCFFNNDK